MGISTVMWYARCPSRNVFAFFLCHHELYVLRYGRNCLHLTMQSLMQTCIPCQLLKVTLYTHGHIYGDGVCIVLYSMCVPSFCSITLYHELCPRTCTCNLPHCLSCIHVYMYPTLVLKVYVVILHLWAYQTVMWCVCCPS